MLTVGHFFMDEAAEGVAGLMVHPLPATLLVDPRDHATAFTWLQAGSDQIYRAPRQPCNTVTRAQAIAAFASSFS